MTLLDWPNEDQEPVNAFSHLAGLILAAVGTVILLRMARGAWETAAFAIYGCSLIVLYAASTLYHAVSTLLTGSALSDARPHRHLLPHRRDLYPGGPFDLARRGRLGAAAAAWGVAAAGIPFKIWFLDAPPWISTGMYLAMGYMALGEAVPLALGSCGDCGGWPPAAWPIRWGRSSSPAGNPIPSPGSRSS